MATNILAIQPQTVHFDTQTNADWLDGLVVWQAGSGGVIPGTGNVGNGTLALTSVAPQTPLGAYVVTVEPVGGLQRLAVADPSGSIIAHGVVGLPLSANGIVLTLSQGSIPFAAGDTFAISVLPVPVDITGLVFTLQARSDRLSANVALAASSIVPAGAPVPTPGPLPTIVLGTTGGQVAMRVLRTALTRAKFAPGTYVYDILASDPVAGLAVPAFIGTISHADGVTSLP